jgi:hypothetical protein
MKTKMLLSIGIPILIGMLLIVGCASTGKIKEPASTDSTLLFGRITLICKGFPGDMHLNGEHTFGIKVHLMDASTKEMFYVRSHGVDGLFHIVDPDGGHYFILGYEIEKKVSPTLRVTMGYRAEDNPYIVIKKNSVNNLGDIRWTETYDTRSKGEHTFNTKGSHDLLRNYAEVENWFKETHPDSAWNRKNWVSMEISTK